MVAVGGLTSEVGKTTLVCDLLRTFAGWEAIKTTRGHYRSCGKDPHTCCVSDLLDTEPVIHSGRELTYARGKDTGRYWDAGAVNVHWLIATDEQVESGIKRAVSLVEAMGVFIEGNSFTEYIDADFFIMVARPNDFRIKATAARALDRASAIYFSSEIEDAELRRFREVLAKRNSSKSLNDLPMFSPRSLPMLIERVSKLRKLPAALAG